MLCTAAVANRIDSDDDDGDDDDGGGPDGGDEAEMGQGADGDAMEEVGQASADVVDVAGDLRKRREAPPAGREHARKPCWAWICLLHESYYNLARMAQPLVRETAVRFVYPPTRTYVA